MKLNQQRPHPIRDAIAGVFGFVGRVVTPALSLWVFVGQIPLLVWSFLGLCGVLVLLQVLRFLFGK